MNLSLNPKFQAYTAHMDSWMHKITDTPSQILDTGYRKKMRMNEMMDPTGTPAFPPLLFSDFVLFLFRVKNRMRWDNALFLLTIQCTVEQHAKSRTLL